MSGKEKCYELKKYREALADLYGVKGFKFKECLSKGKCVGTCSRCDKEVQRLNKKIGFYNLRELEWPNMRKIDVRTPFNIKEYFRNNTSHSSSIVGNIFGIDRLCLSTDGPGITTLVGLKNCSLNCDYCINKDASETYSISVEDLFEIVSMDSLYYIHSGGGICFGGHEPLLQPEFLLEFLKYVRNREPFWKVGIQTSLNVELTDIVKVLLSELDFLIVDIKSMDSDIYKRYTGKDNTLVIENLNFIKNNRGFGRKLKIKVPNIKGYTDDLTVTESIQKLFNMGFLFRDIEVLDYVTPPYEYNPLIDDIIDGLIIEDADENECEPDEKFINFSEESEKLEDLEELEMWEDIRKMDDLKKKFGL